jgi:hypothetical protein
MIIVPVVIYQGPLPPGCYFELDGSTVRAETRSQQMISALQIHGFGAWVGYPVFNGDMVKLEWGWTLTPIETCRARVN